MRPLTNVHYLLMTDNEALPGAKASFRVRIAVIYSGTHIYNLLMYAWGLWATPNQGQRKGWAAMTISREAV